MFLSYLTGCDDGRVAGWCRTFGHLPLTPSVCGEGTVRVCCFFSDRSFPGYDTAVESLVDPTLSGAAPSDTCRSHHRYVARGQSGSAASSVIAVFLATIRRLNHW